MNTKWDYVEYDECNPKTGKIYFKKSKFFENAIIGCKNKQDAIKVMVNWFNEYLYSENSFYYATQNAQNVLSGSVSIFEKFPDDPPDEEVYLLNNFKFFDTTNRDENGCIASAFKKTKKGS